MSQKYRNSYLKNGQRVYSNYSLVVHLATETLRIPLGISDEAEIKSIQRKVNSLEIQSKNNPEIDYKPTLFKICNVAPKVIKKPKHYFGELFNKMVQAKKRNGEIRTRAIELYTTNYRLHLRVFANVDITKFNTKHRDILYANMDKKGDKKTTINIVRRQLITFLNWCKEESYIKSFPKVKQLRLLDEDKNHKKVIFRETFETICSFARTKRDEAYFRVAYGTGLRLRELCTEPNQFDNEGIYHTISRVDNIWQLMVYGKGGKVLPTILPDDLKPYYDIMVKNPISPRALTSNFKYACRLSGNADYYFHNLRASYINNLALSGRHPKQIQHLARHSDLKITNLHYMNDKQANWEIMINDIEKVQYKA